MFEIVGLVFVWLCAGSFTIYARERLLGPTTVTSEQMDRQAGHAAFGGLLWPLYLPLFLMWATGTGRIKKMFPSLPVVKTTEKKVLNYAAAPVTVLSQIIAQKITAEPANLKTDQTARHEYYFWTWESTDKKVSVKTKDKLYRLDNPDGINNATVNGNNVEVDEKIILNAMLAAHKFNESKRVADEEAARQLKALNAVESLLLAPEPKEG